jgi:transposase
MSMRKNHVPAFKAKVALAALSGEKTITTLSSEFGVHQTLIHKWVKQLKESVAGIFSGEIKTEEAVKEKQLHELHAKIGQLTVERDFLAKAWGRR